MKDGAETGRDHIADEPDLGKVVSLFEGNEKGVET